MEIKINDLKRLSNICRDITNSIYPVIEKRMDKQIIESDILKIYVSLNFMVKTYNILRDIHCLLEKKRIERTYATLRSLMEIQVFLSFFLKYPESISAYSNFFIFDHINDIKTSLNIIGSNDPMYIGLNKELDNANSLMKKCTEKYGKNFNSPFGWARIFIEDEPYLSLPKMIKILKLPDDFLASYRSQHKFIHLGNFSAHRDKHQNLLNFTKHNKVDILTPLHSTYETGSLSLVSASAILSRSLKNLHFYNENKTIIDKLKSIESINNVMSEVLSKILSEFC